MVNSLERALRRQFSDTERQTLVELQEQAYRWAFLCSGLTHPNFLKVLEDISPTGKASVIELAKTWS
jgi:hypothetical protein